MRADVLQLGATRDKATREVKDLILQARSRRDITELLKERILPRSRQTLEIAAIDYRSGKLDYLSLMTAWREVFQIELKIAQVEAELGKALASLERTINVEITTQRVFANPTPVSSEPPH